MDFTPINEQRVVFVQSPAKTLSSGDWGARWPPPRLRHNLRRLCRRRRVSGPSPKPPILIATLDMHLDDDRRMT
ncbi:hypothetical protein [Rhizobium sp. FKL33]|uniref:hypothetical protein n=1 Tax=Rhizobium sp. FKL33 TaxID=2562307 RepID=UPI0010C0B18C|nr:hypothetical protein [Rhizobium sp. FKL33]